MGLINFFSEIFGYILNIIYKYIQNYGFSIILFSVIIKLLLLPMSIKQQRTMKKTAKIQGKVKEIQKKYEKDQEKINTEIMKLYKEENMSPFAGCFSVVIQLILLIGIFSLVRNPLTYMKKIDAKKIDEYRTTLETEVGIENINRNYAEIAIIKDVKNKNDVDSEFYINMDFLGLDLSNVPKENYEDLSVLIIPILYVISSVISLKLTSNINKTEENKEENENDMTAQMNKNMMFMMPMMSVMISIMAPLGLALYWLANNILMIIERIVINKILLLEEEGQNE